MNQIKQKIKEIGLSQREISKRLGKNASYLAGVFRTGLSTAKQAELMADLDIVANDGIVQSDDHIIDQLDRTVAKLQAANSELRNESDKYFNELNETKKYLLDSNQEVEQIESKYRAVLIFNYVLSLVILVVAIAWVLK